MEIATVAHVSYCHTCHIAIYFGGFSWISMEHMNNSSRKWNAQSKVSCYQQSIVWHHKGVTLAWTPVTASEQLITSIITFTKHCRPTLYYEIIIPNWAIKSDAFFLTRINIYIYIYDCLINRMIWNDSYLVPCVLTLKHIRLLLIELSPVMRTMTPMQCDSMSNNTDPVAPHII